MANKQHRTGSARGDWNERARQDYRHAIDSTTTGADDEEAFNKSGVNDIGQLRELLGDRDTSSWRALDYGCGAGRLMVPLSKYVAEIDGIDISNEMVRIARERTAGQDRLLFHVLEKNALPFEDTELDLVYSILVFQHMPRATLAAMIPEFSRVLKPGGGCSASSSPRRIRCGARRRHGYSLTSSRYAEYSATTASP